MSYYYEIALKVASHQELFEDFIVSLTHNAIEVGEDSIIIRTEDEPESIQDAIGLFATELSRHFSKDIPYQLSCEKKENIDWYKKYQESIEPIGVGNFYVHPSWHSAKEGAMNIIVDPALAFGSGHHATTNSCLQAIEQHVLAGDVVLDVGCGSGILAIAAAKLGAKVELCDSDEQAVSSAIENFEKNNTHYTKAWVGSVNQADKDYNVVVANIIADVLIILAHDLKKSLKEQGLLILSGILNKYEDKVRHRFKELVLVERIPQDEWVTLVLRKE
jgi:ribosomal protein L11 methyltransferase